MSYTGSSIRHINGGRAVSDPLAFARYKRDASTSPPPGLAPRCICKRLFLQTMITKLHTCTIAAVIALFSQIALLVDAQPVHAHDEINSTSDSTIKEIAECLHQRGEFLVDPVDPTNRCVTPRTTYAINSSLPFNLDHDAIEKLCSEKDRRAFSGDIIKRLVARENGPVGPMGISNHWRRVL